MPSTTRKQQRFMYAEKNRVEHGQKPKTGMTLQQIAEFTVLQKKKGKK